MPQPQHMMPPPRSGEDLPEYVTKRLGIPGIIDVHVHFMPDSVQNKVWQYFDAVGDNGGQAWPIMYRYPEQLRIRILKEHGVSRFSTLNYAHRPGMSAWLNEYSTQFARAHPEAIHSATFYPEDGVEEYVEKALAEGAEIFKTHIQVGDFSPIDPRLDAVWARVAETGIPVVIHCGDGPEPGTHTGIDPVRELVKRHPDLVLVIAHAGLPDYAEFADLASRHDNVYLDTTMVGTDFTEKIAPTTPEFIMMFGGLDGKIVLGTDFPSIPYPYNHQIVALHRFGLGDDWMRNVLWHTPRKLLGWD